MPEVTMYSTAVCPYCVAAKNFLVTIGDRTVGGAFERLRTLVGGTLAEWRDIWRSTRDFVDGFTEANGAAK